MSPNDLSGGCKRSSSLDDHFERLTYVVAKLVKRDCGSFGFD